MFIPRASSFGSYVLCEHRAALDYLVQSGQMADPRSEEDDTKYADLGTCIHYLAQTMVEAEFPPGEHSPDEKQWASAAKLFGDDIAACKAACESTATRLATEIKKIGRYWLAEPSYENGSLTGHIDLLSKCGKVILDIKTTSRKPDHQRMKASHLYQLVAYWILSGRTATTGYILYIDAQHAKWSLLCPYDFTTEQHKMLVGHVEKLLGRISNPRNLLDTVPHIGTHCSSEFCPFRAKCRDAFLPPAGMLTEYSALQKMPKVAAF